MDSELMGYKQIARDALKIAVEANTRSHLALSMVTALRQALAVRSQTFDSDYLTQLAQLQLASLPVDEFERLQKLIAALEAIS